MQALSLFMRLDPALRDEMLLPIPASGFLPGLAFEESALLGELLVLKGIENLQRAFLAESAL